MAIASGTRIEWILADLAMMCAGGATTTVYPTTQHEDVAFILGDSQSKIVVAEDDAQVAKVLDHLDSLPALTKIIQISGRVDHHPWSVGTSSRTSDATTSPPTPAAWTRRSPGSVPTTWPR